MLSLGPLAFAAPWALAAVAALPAIWWLLRVTPPAPARVVFPPIRLLASLSSREETAVRTPWWLMVLRLLLATALILGVARPVLNADRGLAGSGPLYLLVDDGWAAAAGWSERTASLVRAVDASERAGRPVVLLPTAARSPEQRLEPLAMLSAADARTLAEGLQPKPWPVERGGAVQRLLQRVEDAGWPAGSVLWISDGLDQAAGAEPFAELLQRLRVLGEVTVVVPPAAGLPTVLASAASRPNGLDVMLLRAGDGALERTLRLSGDDHAPLSRQTVRFEGDERRLQASLDLPTELSSRLARVEIEGESTAAAVLLLDDRWQRRAVGLTGEVAGQQPLLGARFYLERALRPFADVRHGAVADLLSRPLAMLVLADVGTLDAETASAVRGWVERGGVLLRFAGPRLARETTVSDPLLPLALRSGDRTIGGALSWTGTGRLAAFEPGSPLHGLAIPHDVEIRRQVIAEPSLDVAERVWAKLQDGTPLITGARRGEGWVVLVHTTADPEWSNLPLSGLFVDILKRISELGRGQRLPVEAAMLPPIESLDGFGRLGPAAAEARPIPGDRFAATVVGPQHPPGFYGSGELRRALSLGPSLGEVAPLPPLPSFVQVRSLQPQEEQDLRPWLLGAALLLALLDLAASLWMRGVLRRRPLPAAAGRLAAALLLALLGASSSARAAPPPLDGDIAAASLTTRLAYVRTGDARLDEISAAGLAGLTMIVNRRTAAELGEPVGVNPQTDELAFYPLIYWPLSDGAAPPSSEAARRLIAYMRTGGTIVFDTRGAGDLDRTNLRQIARALDLPPLVPLSADHVLRRAYYLMSELPGRRSGGPVWVERSGEHVNDGVSAVVAGSADWAGAWAMDGAQRPLFAVAPGGEQQRELAYRFGINLVMYVLTGNYKADQVHLPTILERLGQ